jgi:ABC-type polysaccharide/polyol phosphate export permease
LLGTQTGPSEHMILSVVISLVLLVTGMYYFRRMERTFVDMV